MPEHLCMHTFYGRQTFMNTKQIRMDDDGCRSQPIDRRCVHFVNIHKINRKPNVIEMRKSEENIWPLTSTIRRVAALAASSVVIRTWKTYYIWICPPIGAQLLTTNKSIRISDGVHSIISSCQIYNIINACGILLAFLDDWFYNDKIRPT